MSFAGAKQPSLPATGGAPPSKGLSTALLIASGLLAVSKFRSACLDLPHYVNDQSKGDDRA
jgi:hypothetical protein